MNALGACAVGEFSTRGITRGGDRSASVTGDWAFEPAVLFGSLSRGGRLNEVVDAEVVFACVLEDGEALAAHVLLHGRDPQIGNGFHGLTME